MSDAIRIDTPEHVDLAFEPAGIGSRFLAALIDSLIQFFILLVLYLLMLWLFVSDIVSNTNNDLAAGIGLAILILVGVLFQALYKVALEAFWNGQTVGKRLAGVRVVKQNGMPAGFFAILLRNFLRIVDMLPGMYALGIICIVVTQKHQRLGDMAAGTIVVKERKAAVPMVPSQLAGPASTDLDLLREHVLRLSEEDLNPARGMLQRRSSFTTEHRERLARQVADAVGARMGWQQEILEPERFLEEVLYVRAK